MATLLMCRPDYYGIEYEINPWMSRRRPADPRRAARQWQRLYSVLTRQLGAAVELIDPVPGLPDLVFTANAGLVDGDVVVRSNFRYKERRGEQPVFGDWFARRGLRVRAVPGRQPFEGEGDALIVDGTIFAGCRFRSTPSSHRFLEQTLGKPVVSLRLVDPYFYHLDTCFCPLGEGRLLYYPAAFSEESQRRIQRRFPQRIIAPAQEANAFACNAIVLGGAVVTSAGCPVVRRRLEEWGFEVIGVDLSEFMKAGGAAKCLALFLDRPGAAASARARQARGAA